MRIALAYLLSAWLAFGAVAYDAVSAVSFINTGTTLTFSHTTGSGSDRGIAVGCVVGSGSADVQPNISTVTYAGVSLSQLAKRDANYDTYIWTLPDGTQPTTGANNVVVTLAGAMVGSATRLRCAAITATGVDQTTAWTVSNCTGAGTGTTASCTLGANSASDLLFVVVCNGTSIGSSGTGITSRASVNDSTGSCSSLGVGTGAGGTTAVSWTVGSDTWQILAGAWKAAGAAPAAPVLRRPIIFQ